MAAVAQAKGIPVENALFEQWEPAGRRFDRVVFAASFHWVDPAVALPKIRGILNDGGKLALIWNRLRPTDPTRAEFECIYRDYMDVETHQGRRQSRRDRRPARCGGVHRHPAALSTRPALLRTTMDRHRVHVLQSADTRCRQSDRAPRAAGRTNRLRRSVGRRGCRGDSCHACITSRLYGKVCPGFLFAEFEDLRGGLVIGRDCRPANQHRAALSVQAGRRRPHNCPVKWAAR